MQSTDVTTFRSFLYNFFSTLLGSSLLCSNHDFYPEIWGTSCAYGQLHTGWNSIAEKGHQLPGGKRKRSA